MKKITIFFFAICCMICGVFAQPLTAFAAGNNTVIVFEGAKQEQNKVTIDVNVRENSGVYSMLLTLDYDTSALTLDGISYGEALSSLDPLSSGDYSVVPYKISYMGKDKSNDYSTGKMMTITFTVKENTADGEYYISFDYTKNRDITYLSNGEITTKNIIISGAKVTIKDSGIENVITEENNGQNDNNGGTVGIIVAASVAGVSVITLITVLIVRKRRHKWKKI